MSQESLCWIWQCCGFAIVLAVVGAVSYCLGLLNPEELDDE